MYKIVFIDHIYHKKTHSSIFMQKVLLKHFTVSSIHVDPVAFDFAKVKAKIANEVDKDSIIYVWQLDFILPLALSFGRPVLCSPMFDGSDRLPDAHWELVKDVHFINFSLYLHEKALSGGAKSIYGKFYPKPEKPVEFGQGLRGFFWRRRPEHGLDLKLIDRVFGSQMSSLHVHNYPDTPEGQATPFDKTDFKYPVTFSTWFHDVADMHKLMAGYNFYVAPRTSEGIGMAFLEAMSKGMVVAALDAPTHNEYITNGLNGILFNFNSGDVGHVPNPERIARNAIKTITLGYENWCDFRTELLRFVKNVKASAQPDVRPEAIENLIGAYFKGFEEYTEELKVFSKTLTKSEPAKTGVRLLLGREFLPIERESLKYFPIRIAWAREKSVTVVPLDDGEDIDLLVRFRGLLPKNSSARKCVTVWKGEIKLPAEVKHYKGTQFLRIKLPVGSFTAYESLEIRSTLELTKVGEGKDEMQRIAGLMYCEAGVSFVQL